MCSTPKKIATFATVTLLSLAPVLYSQELPSGTDKVWQVRYHKDNANKHGDKALRLRITAASGQNITGTLWRFDGVTGGGSPKYSLRDTGGTVKLTGRITGHGGQGASKASDVCSRRRLRGPEQPHSSLVRVNGLYTTGKDKSDRDDDQILVRYLDQDLASSFRAAGVAPAVGDPDPCDELPPDDDILMEEDAAGETPPDPDYDADP